MSRYNVIKSKELLNRDINSLVEGEKNVIINELKTTCRLFNISLDISVNINTLQILIFGYYYYFIIFY